MLAKLKAEMARQKVEASQRKLSDNGFSATLSSFSAEVESRQEQRHHRVKQFEEGMKEISNQFNHQQVEAKSQHEEFVDQWEAQMLTRRAAALNDRATRAAAEEENQKLAISAAAEQAALDAVQRERELDERKARDAREAAMFAELHAQVARRAEQRTQEAEQQLQDGEARRAALRAELNKLWIDLGQFSDNIQNRLEEEVSKYAAAAARGASAAGGVNSENRRSFPLTATHHMSHIIQMHREMVLTASRGEILDLSQIQLPTRAQIKSVRGSLLGKAEIAKCFRELVRLYHPDKFFQHLGAAIHQHDRVEIEERVNQMFLWIQESLHE